MAARTLPLVLALSLLAAGPVAARQTEPSAPVADTLVRPEPGSELTVSLLTFGPGSAVWELFGHNALRIQNALTGRDDVFHWGVFSFNQVDFIPRFLKGEMLYSMGHQTFQGMVAEYQARDRSVWSQELNLTPAERLQLLQAILVNLQNPEYRYDYFVDNCSTRVRDLLDRVTGGRLKPVATALDGETYRFHTRRLTRPSPLIWAGLDLLLGPRGDRPVTGWESAFVPMVLRDEVRRVELPGEEGRPVPLVASEMDLFVADRPPTAEAPARFNWPLPAVGIGLAVLLALAGQGAGEGIRAGRTGLALLGGVWSLLAGVLGTILVLVWFTDHIWMYWNENVLQFTPLSLLLAVLVPLAAVRGRPSPWAARIALATLVFSLLGLIVQVVPGIDQGNGELIGFALPLHAGLFLALRSLNRSTP